MRLIDADELKRTICRDQCEKDGCDYTCSEISYVVNAPTVAKDKNVPDNWISVKDRLPEKSGHVITLSKFAVISVHDYSVKWKAFNAHDISSREFVDKYNLNDRVLYWLPMTVLPEPPKEDENG